MAEADFEVKAIISAQTSQFERGMKNAQTSVQNLSKGIEGVTKLLKSAFSVVGITASVGAMVNFGKKAVASADEATKRFNILANTIKVTGANTWTSIEALDDMAKAYAKTTNYSVAEVEKMQAILLGFRNITGDTFEEATDAIMDMATVMGMDLSSAVQTVGKALDDPVKGLDSLRRQGFAFTEEQKAELAQLVKNGEQIKAQKIILDELATTYGGASKAGQSAFAKLQHTFDEFRENIGNKLMPVVETSMNKMATLMENITRVLNSSEFEKFISILVNIGNKTKSTLNSMLGYFKNAFNQIKDLILSIDFSPVISVLDTVIGVVKSLVEEVKNNIKKSMSVFVDLKENLAGISYAINVEKIVNIINTVVDVFWFLRDRLKEVQEQIREVINQTAEKIWNTIKNLFAESNKVLEENEKGFSSWAEFIYEVVNNVFRIFQDLIGMISHLLKGNWNVAWEYAKLSVMRVADVILDLISQIANAFPNLINEMIDWLNKLVEQVNKVRGWFGQDPLGLIESFKSVDLSESSGLSGKIQETEKKIAELTGKQADYSIEQIKRISVSSKGLTSSIINDIIDTTNVTIKNNDKRVYSYTSTNSDIEDDTENTYENMSDWDLKLLQQRLDGLKDWGKEYHDIQLQIIEYEKEKAHHADVSGKDAEKINKYYNKAIEKENKRHRRAILAEIKNIASDIGKVFSKLAGFISDGVKDMFSAIKGIMEKFFSLFDLDLDSAIISLLEYEDKILTFFVETLPKLPSFVSSAIESIRKLFENLKANIDKGTIAEIIKGMVTNIANELPGIISDLAEIVSTIFNGITEGINAGMPAINNFAKKLPEIFKNIIKDISSNFGNFEELLNGITDVFETFVTSLADNDIFADLGDLFSKILITVVNSIDNLLPSIEKALDEIIPALGKFITDSIPSIINLLIDVAIMIVKEVPKILSELIKALPVIIKALLDAIPKFFDEGLPELIAGFIEIIPDLIKAGIDITVEIIKHLPEIIGSFIKGLILGFAQVNWWEVIKSIFQAFIDGFKELFGIHSPSTFFQEMGGYMVEGLLNGLKNVGEFMLNIFTKAWEGIKNVFSKIGEWASGIWDSIKDGFSNVGEWFSEKFSNAKENMQIAFSNMGEWFGNVWSDIKDGFANVGEWFSEKFSKARDNTKEAFNNIGDWASGVWDNIKNGFANAGDWFKTTFESARNNTKNAFSNMKTWAGGVWTNIKEGFGNVGTWFSTTFSGASAKIKSAFSGIGAWFKSIWDGIIAVLKAPFNFFIKGINTVINALNKISVTIPDWVPLLGGRTFGVNIPNIKELATGTQNAMKGLTLVGEQGPELVRFNGGEQVLNAKNTQKALNNNAGTSNNFNVTFNNLQDTTAFALMQQLKQYNRQMAINGII